MEEGVTIIGAGGIGCAIGYALRVANIPVTFVEANPHKLTWGVAHGVGVDRCPPVAANFLSFSDWRPRSEDTVILCTKCYDNARVLERVPASATLIPIQNGFDLALEAAGVALEGIASFISECDPQRTHTRITRAGALHLGGRSSNRPSREAAREDTIRLAQALAHAKLFHVEVVADILPYKHTKLMYNAAISPLAAAAGLDNGQLLSIPAARRLFFRLLRENYTILHGAGIALEKIGPFHPRTVSRILSSNLIARALSWAFYPSLRGTYCSMHGDLPTGRTEIDFYNGYLIELAGSRPCPLNRRVYEMVKGMECARVAPGVHVLPQLEAA
ncbi:MAG TPA: ketopantoate reductase C-terminal domain-containing protein [Gemmataceae bacterium]|nr:ketopantoate reductase C-terminal domain-containing protein [Gemmataceae bacterium]